LYYQQLLTKLREVLPRKRPRMLSNGVILDQDNAPPHAAASTQTMLKKQFKWEILRHPPYSPDLSLLDAYVFGRVKQHLHTLTFTTSKDVALEVKRFLNTFAEEYYYACHLDLVHRWKRIIELEGDYYDFHNDPDDHDLL
jgi:hypothetical protein